MNECLYCGNGLDEEDGDFCSSRCEMAFEDEREDEEDYDPLDEDEGYGFDEDEGDEEFEDDEEELL